MRNFRIVFILVPLALISVWPIFGGQAQTQALVYGDGVAAYSLQKFERAFEIWRPLAEAGDKNSRYRLGMLYQDGRGVSLDQAQAAHWFGLAGAAGHGRAAYMLGNMYATGTGVEENPAQAFAWFLRSAESGSARAQFHVAIAYLDDGVVRKNLLEAYIWFKRAGEGFSQGIDKNLANEASEKTFTALNGAERAEAARRLENSPGE